MNPSIHYSIRTNDQNHPQSSTNCDQHTNFINGRHINVDIDDCIDEPGEYSIYTAFTESGVPGLKFTTPYEVCLRPFLEAMGWEGADRHVIEALPHMDAINDLDNFRTVISRLGFTSKTYNFRLDQINPDFLPAVIVFEDENPAVILSADQKRSALIFDPVIFDFREIICDKTNVRCCIAESAERVVSSAADKPASWFSTALYGVKGPLLYILFLTLFATCASLATPLYVMFSYNTILAGKSIETLPFAVIGILLIIIFEIYVRIKRGALIAFCAARLSSGIINSSFFQLLSLPIGMIESAPVGAQTARIKQFEGIPGFLTGPIGIAFLDLPFLVFIFAAIAIISPTLVLVPILLTIFFAVIVVYALPGVRQRMSELNTIVSRSNIYIADAMAKKVTIHQMRVERDWVQRFVKISRELADKRFRIQLHKSFFSVVGQSLMMLAGVSTMLVGAILVMEEKLSIGGLIAIMMLIWRLIAPIQIIFTNIETLFQFLESIKQINQLMTIHREKNIDSKATPMRTFEGRVTFSGVAFRYGYQQDPIFRNLNLDIPEKQFVCIESDALGGKSTILKLIIGLYKPQSGGIYIDGTNNLQLDPSQIRNAIGFLPLEPELFYGTVSQNIRIANPLATNSEIKTALAESGLDMHSDMFPANIETRLTAEQLTLLPIGVKQCISLARLFCCNASIYLMNDPAASLDKNGEQALLTKLNKLKGTATIILISNRLEHHLLSDRVIKLQNGNILEDRITTD